MCVCVCVCVCVCESDPTFGVEGPLRPVVLVQVYPLLLAQRTHLVVELPGDVHVGRWDGPGHALGSEEAVDLG